MSWTSAQDWESPQSQDTGTHGPSLTAKLMNSAGGFYCSECDILPPAPIWDDLATLSNEALKSISFPEDSPARISALLEMELAWLESEAVYFGKSLDSLASYDPNTSTWKMSQQSLFQTEEVGTSLPSLPDWGMTVDGVLYPLIPLRQYPKEPDGFYWPRPLASSWKGGRANPREGRNERNNYQDFCRQVYGQTYTDPTLSEYIMGIPPGWSDPEVLEIW